MSRRVSIDEKRLLEIALGEFASKSFDEVSVNRIIERAQISKGSFYYRFSDKYELYVTLLKLAADAKWEYISQNVTIPDDRDLFSLFSIQAEAGFAFAQEYPEYADLAIRFNLERGSQQYEKAKTELYSADNSGLEKMIDTAYEAGEFSNQYSKPFVKSLISFLFSSFDQMFQDSKEDPQVLIEQLIRCMKYGLSKDRP